MLRKGFDFLGVQYKKLIYWALLGTLISSYSLSLSAQCVDEIGAYYCGNGGVTWTYNFYTAGEMNFTVLSPPGYWFYSSDNGVSWQSLSTGLFSASDTILILGVDYDPTNVFNYSALSWNYTDCGGASPQIDGGADCILDGCGTGGGCGVVPPTDCDATVPGEQSPGDPCNDNNPNTGNDVYDANCICMGAPYDCNDVAGGPALPGTACDDGNPFTSGDTLNNSCDCVGNLDCDASLPGYQTPGTACDDGNAATPASYYDSSCLCQGDCDLAVSGFQSPGQSCNDGDPSTSNDVYGSDCICAGVFDCSSTMPGIQSPGDACDDGNTNTPIDIFDSNCDCIGYCSYGIAGNFVPGDPCDDVDPNTTGDSYNAQCICTGTQQSIIVRVKLLLEGPYNASTGLMSTALGTTIPLSQPYGAYPYNYAGTEIAASIPPAVSDWVYMQIRDTDQSTILGEAAGFLRNDGEVLDANGNIGISFNNITPGSYYITVYHRAHLGVMSAAPVALPNSTNAYDFTTAQSQAIGVVQLKLIDATALRYGLFVGDYDGSGVINNHDYNAWYSNNSGVNQYLAWDGNLSAVVNNLDYNLWFNNRSKVGTAQIQLP